MRLRFPNASSWGRVAGFDWRWPCDLARIHLIGDESIQDGHRRMKTELDVGSLDTKAIVYIVPEVLLKLAVWKALHGSYDSYPLYMENTIAYHALPQS